MSPSQRQASRSSRVLAGQACGRPVTVTRVVRLSRSTDSGESAQAAGGIRLGRGVYGHAQWKTGKNHPGLEICVHGGWEAASAKCVWVRWV